jgi:two-component system NtrC family response regulator
VLISGQTGTGKEIFARAVHTNSLRSNASLVVVDCAALPQTLVESLLFGHEKGVYTGADKAREGLIAQADGGTLFLDEIGELSPEIQKVFLRVLQERKYRPVGGRRELPSNFRLVAATNRNLDEMVADGKFRKDLLYRIRTTHIALPPLRDRSGDIKKLTTHYLSVISERSGKGCKGMAPDFMETLNAYTWPGNVRELINAMEAAIANAEPETTLYARHLPQDIRLRVIRSTIESHQDRSVSVDAAQPLNADVFKPRLNTFKAFRKTALFKVEKQYLQALLDQSQNNLDKSLDISGLSRSRLYDLLKQHNLSL